MKKITLLLASLFCSLSLSLQAQKTNSAATEKAKNQLTEKRSTWGLTKQDVAEIVLQDSHTDEKGVTFAYFQQKYNSIEVYNAIANVAILPNGEVLTTGNRFEANLSQRINNSPMSVTLSTAVGAAGRNVGIPNIVLPRIKTNTDGISEAIKIEGGKYSQEDIQAKIKYFKTKKGDIRLVWDIFLAPNGTSDHWNIKVDALTSEVLGKTNQTVYCQFHDKHLGKNIDFQERGKECKEGKEEIKKEEKQKTTNTTAAASYNVLKLPIESPSHGNFSLTNDPAIPSASPFGWHDVNGIVGAEYTITRGNNVHAYLDLKDTDQSSGGEPDGGSSLTFNFPYNANSEPTQNTNVAQVNLFYVSNMTHDILFQYGFTEAAGNFQVKNYSGTGKDGDHVRAEAQDGSQKDTLATFNNANFSTPADGSPPRMQMFLWERIQSGNLLHITAPQSAIKSLSVGTTASWGAAITPTRVTGLASEVSDGSANPKQGCNTIETNLTNRVALIDRGNCNFSKKAINAQNAGAKGVVIINFEENVITMAAGDDGPSVTIPVVMVRASDGKALRNLLDSGLQVSFYNPNTATGPEHLDGDFDNGIIVHEYGHGVSNRLTGGPSNVNCLNNDEQMGEGWSDFLALALTTKAGSKGTDRRGTGSFVTRQPITGQGIRNFPYSTDMAINALTYDEIIRRPEEHDLGEVWTVMLWDLYWAMVEKYGFDENLLNTQSGNGKALRLVMDGMKLQPCSPGFVDGRNAILNADFLNFNNENKCTIWSAFARRGLGLSALQGNSNDAQDNTEAYDIPLECEKGIVIRKSTNKNTQTGATLPIRVLIRNNKSTAVTNLKIVETLPDSLTYIAGSASQAVIENGKTLTFNISNLNANDSVVVIYNTLTAATAKSKIDFFEDFERGGSTFTNVDLKTPNTGNSWAVTTTRSTSGRNAMSVSYLRPPLDSTAFDQALTLVNFCTIAGAKPVLRFSHAYSTKPSSDGGIVQIATADKPNEWQDLGSRMFRSGYRGKMTFTTFAIPDQKGFWGNNLDDFLTTYVDLSDFKGKSVKFRFRYGTLRGAAATGWTVDDVLLMDMQNYNIPTIATTTQKDTVYADLPFRGAIVDTATVADTNKVVVTNLETKIFPNPFDNVFSIDIKSPKADKAEVTVYTIDGKLVYSVNNDLLAGQNFINIDFRNRDDIMFLVKIKTQNSPLQVHKIVRQRGN